MRIYKSTVILVLSLFYAADLFAMDFDQLSAVNIHGFISQGYLRSTDNNYIADTEDGSFEFNEMGINFSTEPTENLRVGLQLFAQDIGRIGNDEVTLDWAFGDYRFHNMCGVRGGKLKMAHGLYGESRDIDAVRTGVLLPRTVYPIDMRDVFVSLKGVGVYGELPGGFSYQTAYGVIGVQTDSDLLSLLAGQTELGARVATYDTYYALAVSGQAPVNPSNPAEGTLPALDPVNAKAYAQQVSTGVFGSEYATSMTDDVNPKVAANASLKWQTPMDGLRCGISLVYGELDMDVNLSSGDSVTIHQDHLSATTLSIEYLIGDTILSAEGIQYRIKANLEGTIGGLPVNQTTKRTMPGWYAGFSHRFTYWLELGGYYGELYEDDDDRDGENYRKVGLPAHLAWEKDACLSARFDINEYWIIKIEGHRLNGTYQMKESALSTINDAIAKGKNPLDAVEEDYFLFAAKFSYSF